MFTGICPPAYRLQAIDDGYDEITPPCYFYVMMITRLMTMVDKSNGMAGFQDRVATAKDVKLIAFEPMKSL